MILQSWVSSRCLSQVGRRENHHTGMCIINFSNSTVTVISVDNYHASTKLHNVDIMGSCGDCGVGVCLLEKRKLIYYL